jgi:hypothetical protein
MEIDRRIGLVLAFSAACAAPSCIPAFAQAAGGASPAAGSAAATPDGGMLTLKLRRPERKDYAAEMRFEYHDIYHYRYSRMGTPLKQFEVRCDVVSDMIVRTMAVNEQGDGVKFRAFVKSLHATREYPKVFAQTKTLLPSPAGIHCQGATVIVSEDPKRTFARADGHALTPTDIRYLSLFFPASSHPDRSNDTALDPDHSVGVGDTWTPDAGTVQHLLLRRSGLEVEPGTLDVSETFTDRSTVAGVDAATVTLQVTSDSITVPGLDATLNDPSGSLAMTLTLVVPVEDGAPELADHLHAAINYSGLYKKENLEGVEYSCTNERDLSSATVRIIH